MDAALLDSGDDPYLGARVVILSGDNVGEVATITGVHKYYSMLAGQYIFTLLADDGSSLLGGRDTFEVSIYQNEPLEDVPSV